VKQFLNDMLNKSDVFVASISLLIAAASMLFGGISLIIQRSHNKKSLMPIGVINVANYENRLAISIINNGIGPMIIKKIKTFKTSDPNISKDYPIDWFQGENIGWVTYRKSMIDHAINSGKDAILLEFSTSTTNENPEKIRDKIRETLSGLTLSIEYEGVYRKHCHLSRNLIWFSGISEQTVHKIGQNPDSKAKIIMKQLPT